MEKKPAKLKALEKVRVVLVGSKFSGNIGMIARVMKNLGFFDLRLVRPRAELNKDAYARAVYATELIDEAKIHADLYEAVSDCGIVIGTSRRHAEKRKNLIGMEQMTELLKPALAANNIAVVFGSEDTGLSNEDARCCYWLVKISPGTGYDTFSVNHAAALVLWEINKLVRAPAETGRAVASAQELENFYRHMSEIFTEIEYIEPGDPRRMMLSFRTLFNRAMLTTREVNMVRGIFSKIKWKIDKHKK